MKSYDKMKLDNMEEINQVISDAEAQTKNVT